MKELMGIMLNIEKNKESKKMENLHMKNYKEIEKLEREKKEANVKKWKKRMYNSYSMEILLDSFIPYFETTGKNFYNYGDIENFEKDLQSYKKLRKDFIYEKKRIEGMIHEYQTRCSRVTEVSFEVNYFKFFKLQMEIMELAKSWQPKIMKYCQSTKAGW